MLLAGTKVRINLQETRAPDNFFTQLRISGLRNTDCFLIFALTKPHGSAAVGAHSSVGQSSGLIIRRSWDHAPLGPPAGRIARYRTIRRKRKRTVSRDSPFFMLQPADRANDQQARRGAVSDGNSTAVQAYPALRIRIERPGASFSTRHPAANLHTAGGQARSRHAEWITPFWRRRRGGSPSDGSCR